MKAIDHQPIFVPASPVIQKSIILRKKISAIRLESAPAAAPDKRLGAVLQMPAGSHLEICGEGFNSRTIKVRSAGAYFFVFRDDIGETSAN